MKPTLGNVYFVYCSWIPDAHEKLSLCVCDQKNLFFWFNSKERARGIAQLPVKSGEHAAITKDCFLDLSSVKQFTSQELKAARDFGPLQDPLKARVLAELSSPIKPLPDVHRLLALANLT